MTVTSPTVEKDLYIFVEDHVVRTGILMFYDPLLFSDLYTHSLAELDAIDDTIPSVDPATNLFPTGINAATISLEIL